MPVVFRGASISAVAFVAQQAITMVAYIVLARLASPSTFGAYAAAAIIVSTAGFLAESGMAAALVQRSAKLESAIATATVSTFVGGALLSLLALAFAPAVGIFFESAQIGQVSAVLSGLLLVNAAAVVPGALLQRDLSYRPLLISEPLAAAALGIAGGIALAAGMGIWGLAVGAYAFAFVRTFSIWVIARWLPRFGGSSWVIWRELAGFARHVVASEGLRQAGSIVTTAVIGRSLGTEPLGEFRYGWRIATTGSGVVGVGSYVLYPVFSRIAGQPARFRHAFERSVRVSALALFPIAFLFVALGQPLVVLLFGQVWSEAGWVLVALAGLPAAAALGSVSSEAVKAAGRPDILPFSHLLGAGLPVLLIFPLLRFGAVGVGLAFSIGLGITAIYILLRAAAVVTLPARIALRQLVVPTVAGALAASLVLGLDQLVLDAGGRRTLVGFVLLALETLLGALVYFGLAAALSRQAASELRAIRAFAVARLRRT
jgi:PST family polysaccharide transporter